MRIPRDLSGSDLVSVLCRHWGYVKVGSHIILQTQEPTQHRVAVPAHKTLRVGTINSVLRDVSNHKGVDRQAILDSLG